MENVSAVIEICSALGRLWSLIERQIDKVSHRTSIPNLKEKIKDLQITRDNVERKMDEAALSGEIVLDNASAWLKDATDEIADGEKLLEEELKRVERCSCLNVYSRYQLGNQLIKKTATIDQLEKRGSKFDTVSQLAPRPSFGSRFRSPDFEDFESRKSVFEEVMRALKDEGRPVIGIYGMGGVGKTTMVQKLGARAMREQIFDEVVLAVVSQNPDVRKIQYDLAEQLCLELAEKSDEGRAGRLHLRLNNGKKILVILDDIWDYLNMREIGIPFLDGINGSKVLLTSRKQNVCREMQDENPISIKHLSDEEALNLFHKKVGNTKTFPGMLEISQKLCQECGGLPVAILAVAGALKSKDKPVWDNVLEQLSTSNLDEIEGVDKKVCASLMVSYDQLKSKDARLCFLLCCLFPEDFNIPIELLMRFGRGMGILGDIKRLSLREARNKVYGLVDKLKDYCLLLEGKDKEHVKMHDIVRDVAISIASEGQFFIVSGRNPYGWPEKENYDSYTAISLTCNHNIINELPEDLEWPKLHTLILRNEFYFNGILNTTRMFFSGMKKLKVLALESLQISSMPAPIQNLDVLRVLSLEYCDLGDITLIGELKRLEMLILRGSNVKELPSEIGNLTQLRLLDLRNCTLHNVISPHAILRLFRLEELFMPVKYEIWGYGGSNDREKSANLKPLSRLESLEIYVPNFDEWPRQASFPFLTNLTSFKISINAPLSDAECKRWRKVLKLKDVSFRCGVDVLLRQAEALYIYEMKDLKYFCVDNGERASSSYCKGLQASPGVEVENSLAIGLGKRVPLEPFSKLNVLKIENTNLKYLFTSSTVKVFVQLQALTVEKCENVEAIVGSYERAEGITDMVIFSSLKHLLLKDLPKLMAIYPKKEHTSHSEESPAVPMQPLFNEKVAFPELEELVIDNVGQCKEMLSLHLPAQESFSKLRKLTVEKMNNISIIGSPTFISRLQSLKELELWNCGSLRAIFPSSPAKVFDQLQALRVEKCENVEAIVGSYERAADIIDVAIFSSLKRLRLKNLPKLKGMGIYPKMEAMEHTSRLEERPYVPMQPLFNEKVAFPELEELVIDNVGNYKEMVPLHLPAPEPFSKLREMNNLSIIGFPTSISRLHSLRELELWNCCSIRAIFPPSTKKVLVQLEALRVEKCENVEAIVGKPEPMSTDMVIFSSLKRLWLKNLPKLMGFYPKTEHTCLLDEDPYIPMQPLFNEKVAFPELEVLLVDNVGQCKEMVSFHLPPQDSFSKLRKLTVQKMNNLSIIGSSTLISRLQSLRLLQLWNCCSLRAIFKDERRQKSNEEEIVAVDHGIAVMVECPEFSALQKLWVFGCRLLKEFCWDECSPSKEEREETDNNTVTPFFNNKNGLPKLRELLLLGMDNVKEERMEGIPLQLENHMWVMGGGSVSSPPPFLSFQCLSSMSIKGYGDLRNLFSSPSTALVFAPNLRTLTIVDCGRMDEIVSGLMEKDVAVASSAAAANHDPQIIFPRLVDLWFENLPNLTRLCPFGYLLFHMSSLKKKHIEGCPKVVHLVSRP